ncbi:hypothetical protein Rhopal_004948-T1 [Rhodotorula paludigena]|uniref:P-loop containing nucleoside triphosphate hydrolase protein n=1 Tax=Rhodotorula paludigena TaxID=86838 RepID=A0AAV5GP18_9BASI|nr:hypothetical protein Rhopal_004948-T1 [Rhodotorula paludigena]
MHDQPVASTSSSSPCSLHRRDAHALAARVKFDRTPPPPPLAPSAHAAAPSSRPPPQGQKSRSSSFSDSDPLPADDLLSDFTAFLQQSLAEDYANARHPKWDERGLESYDSEPVLPEALEGTAAAGTAPREGETVVGDEGRVWENEEEWVELLRRQAEEEVREEEAAAEDAPLDERIRAEEALAAAESAAPSPLPLAVDAPLAAPPPPRPRRVEGPLRLERVPPFDPTLIQPYLPPAPPADPSHLERFHAPLSSRHDWRLSSPLRRYLRSTPPPLYSRTETDTRPLGHNRLVGVGVEAARIARVVQTQGEEKWGWKVRVPESERGAWNDADRYCKRMDRLLDLSRKADETLYRASLARSGTPAERELKGLTLMRALGTWLTDSSRVDKLKQEGGESAEDKSRKREGGSAAATGGQRAVAAFEAEDGRLLTPEKGWKWTPGSILRITRPAAHSGSKNGPQLPPGAAGDDQWHVQGTLLEVRDEQLIVAFEESDTWSMGDEEAYQIDIGLDLSSYDLQSAALSNLYLDPARQRTHNATQVLALQQAFGASGAVASLREWTLQGTELRELVVPASAPSSSSGTTDLSERPNVRSAAPSLGTSAAKSAATETHSDVLRDNQLINSWIERYQRDDPIVLPGDPDLGLNESQTKAIAMALGEKLSLIQGPPGTGKSQTIVSLIALLKLHFRVPSPILLAAPTHVSVDHLVLLLVRAGLNPLRCGKASKVTPEAQPWTIERRQEQHPMWDRLEQAREESEGYRVALQEHREARREAPSGGGKEAEEKDLELEGKYRKAWRKFIMLEHKLYSSLLATADVFCATALGSGASKVLNMVDFPIVLLDEAAMCTEPVSLIPLMKGARHATLIGDHKQLPAVVTSQEAKDERLHISLFERLLISGKVKSTLLDTQYRMRPSISSFPNSSFYHGALRDAPAVSSRPPPLQSRFFGPSPHANDSSSTPEPVAFVSHTGRESPHRQSLLNRAESHLLISLVGDLLSRNPSLAARDIGIISPYYAQTRLLVNTFSSGYAASVLRASLGARRAAEASEVEVNTVDGFQGREKRVVLLSTVRSNERGQIGFLTDQRRLNVALTRARDALIVVGNEQTLRRAEAAAASGLAWRGAPPGADPDADAGVWKRFLDWCAERGLVRQWDGDDTA